MLNNLNIKCKLCGCTEVELQDYKIRNITDDSCKMYKCKNCETHFMYPLPSQDLSEYYDGTFREEVILQIITTTPNSIKYLIIF